MNSLPLPERIARAHVLWNGPHGEVSRFARLQPVSRQPLYRQAHARARSLDGAAHRARLTARQAELDQVRRQLRAVQQRPRPAVTSADELARFAATAQAEGVSLPVAGRRLTQGLLDLKRLYWNARSFRTGRRKGKSPYQRLGLSLGECDGWDLLHLPPEQLRDKLSASANAA